MNEAKGDRFFRAMVLMGSAVALGCGGSTSRNNEGSGGSGPTGTGGTGGSGGSGSGGSGPGTGGTVYIDPTTATATTSVEPGPFPCVPAQFECASAVAECAYELDGWRIPQDCTCSDARPASAADCGPDQSFVCLRGGARSDGTPFTEVVPFQCSCVDRALNCEYECYAAGFRGDLRCDTATGEGGAAGASTSETLCGCAYVLLK